MIVFVVVAVVVFVFFVVVAGYDDFGSVGSLTNSVQCSFTKMNRGPFVWVDWTFMKKYPLHY